MPSLQTFLRDLRNSTQIKTPSETLLHLHIWIIKRKQRIWKFFFSTSNIKKMIQFPTQKFAWFQTVEDANNWYFERKFSGPNFVWTLADIGNCIVFFSFNFAKLYHISVASLRILSRDLLTPKSVTTHHSRHHISSVVISRKFQGTFTS